MQVACKGEVSRSGIGVEWGIPPLILPVLQVSNQHFFGGINSNGCTY
jgi:hypothetical protein